MNGAFQSHRQGKPEYAGFGAFPRKMPTGLGLAQFGDRVCSSTAGASVCVQLVTYESEGPMELPIWVS